MRFGITSDLVRVRTLEPAEAARVARAVVRCVRGLDERRLIDLFEQFSEGQILAFDCKNKLIGWSLHLRVSEATMSSSRRVGAPSLELHDAQGAFLVPFERETSLDPSGSELRAAFEVARQALVAGLGLQQGVKGGRGLHHPGRLTRYGLSPGPAHRVPGLERGRIFV
jgi:hypothetical protein